MKLQHLLQPALLSMLRKLMFHHRMSISTQTYTTLAAFTPTTSIPPLDPHKLKLSPKNQFSIKKRSSPFSPPSKYEQPNSISKHLQLSWKPNTQTSQQTPKMLTKKHLHKPSAPKYANSTCYS
ncbi:hypothetical protein M758_UG072400 [Ceratodon purpureus]|nr:hypothetical protein M758_UG072400 [Ceratodon purpureus]